MAEISKPYAKALFELALTSKELDPIYNEVLEILKVFNTEKAFVELINNPQMLKENKIAFLKKVFPGLNTNISGLMDLMIKKGRETYVEAALIGFVELTKEHKGEVDALVYSASPLSEEQLKLLKSKLSVVTGKQVEIDASVDTALIGGLYVKIGNMIIDNTIKKHLHTLKRQLA